MPQTIPTTPGTPASASRSLSRKWDTDTAACAIVVGSLLFLFAVRRGFKGLVVGVG